jgi:sphingomyelin phosphodiesterase acid-like 3
MLRRWILAVAFVLGTPLHLASSVDAAPRPPWLFVTDLHFDPRAQNRYPARADHDSNSLLVDSTIAEMKRTDPHAPVVVIGGDFLAHQFDWARAVPTIRDLARRFDRAFPNAQFIITLGNEDSPCGDYRLTTRSAFLREVAQTWEPLVNRRGVAPDFATAFARDGSYTARLPIPNTRAVVVDDVFWAPRYATCSFAPFQATQAGAILDELGRTLRSSHERQWLVLHIPPGVDAYSTAHLLHGLAVLPFLDPTRRDQLLALIADPRDHVTLVVAAHTHTFAYRIAGTARRPVPMLLVPSVSPIFGNAPAFLTAQVDSDGTLRDMHDHALLSGEWTDLGGYASLGVPRFTGAALGALNRRLASDPDAQQRFALLYESGAFPEIGDADWPVYRCAATAFSTRAFGACTGEGGSKLLTRRGIDAVVIGAIVLVTIAVALIVRLRRRSRRART